MSIKVLLADDHRVFREGLRALLERSPDFRVVGEAESGRTAVRLARELGPDVIVMDISMPDLNGIDAARQIAGRMPHTRIVALSMHSDRRFVTEMLKAGARGYLLKDCTCDELILAIRTAAAGKTYLSPAVADEVVKAYLDQSPESAGDSDASALTDRQREVLQLLAEGRTTRQIALHLHVSIKTVETHRHQIMDKLNIHSIAELTKYAVREGLTSL
jgi:two-component system, NarL family, response regulator NreC